MEFYLKKDTATTPHEKVWQFAVGSCHAPLAHRVDYLEQLKFVHDELGINRVRFHGLFNDDMNVGMCMRDFVPLPVAKKYKQISFYQIGRVFDNLKKIGMQPFVELGFMPEILASGKRKCNFQYKGNITMPKNLKEWGKFITDFMNFIIDRYGIEEVRQWYFEVWNEPNLPVFFAGSKKDYFKLYETTARAVKAVDPHLIVGGPSTANCAWIDDFTEFVRKNNVPCDFISTHQYAGDPIGHVFDVGPMVKGVLKSVREMRKKGGGNILEGTRMIFRDNSEAVEDRNIFMENERKIKPFLNGLPLLYTEWNVSATCTAPINDTRRASSYAIKTVLDAEGEANGLSFWSFSDIFEELQFYPQPFSGSFGMLNIYGIPKPSFYAFKILSMLGDERYVLDKKPNDKIEMNAFKKEDKIQILVYRQSFKKTGTPEKVVIKAETACAPSAVALYRIDEQHCNPLRVWQQMGEPEYLKPEDVEYIKNQSALTKESSSFDYNDGTVIIECNINENDVYLFEIE